MVKSELKLREKISKTIEEQIAVIDAIYQKECRDGEDNINGIVASRIIKILEEVIK